MRYFVESYGCTMNFGEGVQLSDRMAELGHERVTCADDAEIVVLNTCIVVSATEKKMIKRISELRRSGKEVVVTGCMAKVQPERIAIRLPDSLIVPPEDYPGFTDDVVSRYGRGDAETAPSDEHFGIIPIAQGCLGNCTYCITRFARGRLASYPAASLKTEFDRMVAAGAKEILLTAQDTACYGRDIGGSLADLIAELLENEEEYRIRIGMMNPDSLDEGLDDLLEVIADDRVYRFLHIPVQSGSDDVLAAMKRKYTVDGFKGLVGRLRSRYPEISIATDVITGFPGETDEDHRMSVELLEWLKADTVNITRFSPRPGTPAMQMEHINGRIVAERSAEITGVKNSVESMVNSRLIGRTYRALVTEKGKAGTSIARNENYRPIAVEEDLEPGTFIDVEVTDYASTHLFGRRLNK